VFENLTQRLGGALSRLRGHGRLSEDNIREALREVRMALLEADVALPVVKTFVDMVRERALGQEVLKSLSPGQALIKIVHAALVEVMGQENQRLNLAAQPPAVVLMAGLQGAGKTTTAAKLARFLQAREKKKVMLASCDVHRPAAIEQLRTLAAQINTQFYASADQDPVAIASEAVSQARKQHCDVLILDTAGRLHIDAQMMDELAAIDATVKPVETLFVVDSMTGQDAANTAKAFGDALNLSGVILTKTDGDARGGAALSVRTITGKPIKFLGVGEKIDALEPFHPDRLASRILGMGDVLSLVEEAEQKVDQAKAQKLAKKLQKGKGFDLTDLRDQFEQMQNMGGMASLLDKLPGGAALPAGAKAQLDDRQTARMIAIINAMTPQERRYPAVINGSRKRRIAAGSGVQVQDVNRLLKQHHQMGKMMKKMSKGKMANMMRGMRGRLPPGLG